MRWHALQVRSQYEQRAEAALLPRIEAFYPWREQKCRLGAHDRIVRRAWFPGYIFAKFEHASDLPSLPIPTGWHVVGVVPDIEIESVKILALSKQPMMEHGLISIGETVRVQQGPFAGVEGKVLRFGSGALLVVSIGILGRAVATQLDLSSVSGIKAPSEWAGGTGVPTKPC